MSVGENPLAIDDAHDDFIATILNLMRGSGKAPIEAVAKRHSKVDSGEVSVLNPLAVEKRCRSKQHRFEEP